MDIKRESITFETVWVYFTPILEALKLVDVDVNEARLVSKHQEEFIPDIDNEVEQRLAPMIVGYQPDA